MLIFAENTFADTNQSVARKLMPIGGGYADVCDGFAEAVVANAKNGRAKILVLPISYSSNPDEITLVEREQNIKSAEQRRSQIEAACQRATPAGSALACAAILAPIFSRTDAFDPANQKFFTDDLAAIFILGGDQTIAMQIIIGTPIEELLSKAYQRGVIIAGTSAGAAVQSITMLGGYQPNFVADNSLDLGAVNMWNTAQKHGLPFGIQDAILDQHFFQRGRAGRLLNAIAQPNVPHVGIGVDAFTGAHAPNGTRLEKVFGLYTVAVLDAETYHSAEAAQYRGAENTLSLRNVIVNLLAPGDFAYDLVRREHSLAPAPAQIHRTFDALTLPKGAGALMLVGDLSATIEKSNQPILARFVELAGGKQANLAIVVVGYPSEASATSAANEYATALGTSAQIVVPTKGKPLVLPTNVTGIVFVGKDQAKLDAQEYGAIKHAWLAGTPLLADNAAAAAVGAYYSAHESMPRETEQAETVAQKSFLYGNTQVVPGLGLLNVTFEPQILGDNRWGRLFSLAYQRPEWLALGLNRNTALEITTTGARVLGANVVFALDLRSATLALGTNEGFVIANGLLDVFAMGDAVKPIGGAHFSLGANIKIERDSVSSICSQTGASAKV